MLASSDSIAAPTVQRVEEGRSIAEEAVEVGRHASGMPAGRVLGGSLATAEGRRGSLASEKLERVRRLQALMVKAKAKYFRQEAECQPELPRGSGVIIVGSVVMDLFPARGALVGALQRHGVPMLEECIKEVQEPGSQLNVMDSTHFVKVKNFIKAGRVRWVHAVLCPSDLQRSRRMLRVRSARRPQGFRPKAKAVGATNTLVKRTVQVARLAMRMGGVFTVASPVRSLLWRLSCILALQESPGVRCIVGDTCCFGGFYRRTVQWITNAPFLAAVSARCPGGTGHLHRPGDGPPGVELPEGLCNALADAYLGYIQANPSAGAAVSRTVHVDQYRDPLTPSKKEVREQENRECIGGMRDASRAVARLPGWRVTGARLRAVIEGFLNVHGQPLARAMRSMGMADASGPPEEWVEHLRAAVADSLGAASRPEAGLQGWLARAVGKLAGDPDDAVVQWFSGNVPVGVTCPIPPGGVFPRISQVDQAQDIEKAKMLAIQGEFNNYQSLDDFAQEAQAELAREAQEGYLDMAQSRSDLEQIHGTLVPSRIAVLVKEKEGVQKVRLIHDLRRSGINSRLCLPERVVLPRINDVTRSVLDLYDTMLPGEGLSFMSLDFKDAFKQMEVAASEKRFLSGKVGGRWFVYNRVLFGIASGPLLWGRIGAFIGRSTQSLFKPGESRLHLFVDDPLQVVRGTPSHRFRLHMVAVAWWLALGVKVAWRKGALGERVDWIGAQLVLASHARGLRVTIPDAKREELLEACRAAQSEVGGIRAHALRRLAGRCSWVAGLVPQLRPFVRQVWGATAAVGKDALVPLRRYQHAVAWVAAFCEGSPALVKDYFLEDRYAPGFTMEVDASPWGGGAVLWSTPDRVQGSAPLRYMVVAWNAEDEYTLRARIGAARSQATWEAFMMLLAIRQWAPLVRRGCLCVCGDASGVLTGLVRMRAASSIINQICKELALVIAPHGLHLAGIHIYSEQNVLADALSRMPVGAGLPHCLAAIPRDFPAGRARADWHFLGSEPRRCAS